MRNFIVGTTAALLFGFSSLLLAETVDINTADAATLALHIKGVGEKKAEAIVAYRKQHGAFNSVDDLTLVPGIGPRVLEDNRDNLVAGKSR